MIDQSHLRVHRLSIPVPVTGVEQVEGAKRRERARVLGAFTYGGRRKAQRSTSRLAVQREHSICSQGKPPLMA